jgi:hypothetical protein
MERLALIEVIDHDGRVMQAVSVAGWPVTVGRALDCDVMLNDPYIAAHHATLDAAQDGSPGVVITIGQSVNGVRLAGRLLPSGSSARLVDGSEFHAGRSTLRVRLAGEALAAEKPLPDVTERVRRLLTAGGLAMALLWLAALLWLENLPGSGWDKYLPALLAALFGMVVWSSLWGLGSKLFQRHFRIMPHLRLLIEFLLVMLFVDAALALASFALSLPWLSFIRGWVRLAMFVALVGRHVALLLPGRQRFIAVTLGALYLLVIGVEGALSWRHHQRLFEELYASTLPPPALRLVRADPVTTLLEDLRPLRDRLERQASEDEEIDAAAER